MRHAIRPCGCTVFHFIITHITFGMFCVFPHNKAFGSATIPQACWAGNGCCPFFHTSSEANSYCW